MNFLFLVLLFLVSDSLILWYLVNSEYFSPQTLEGAPDIWNIIIFVLLIAGFISLLSTLLFYLFEKFLYCGRKEFPGISRSVKLGIIVFILLVVTLLLHIFHFLSYWASGILLLALIIGIILIR